MSPSDGTIQIRSFPYLFQRFPRIFIQSTPAARYKLEELSYRLSLLLIKQSESLTTTTQRINGRIDAVRIRSFIMLQHEAHVRWQMEAHPLRIKKRKTRGIMRDQFLRNFAPIN